MSKRNSTSPAALYLRDRKNNPVPIVKFTHAKIEALPIPTKDEGEYEARIEGKVGLRCRVRLSGVKSFEVVAKPANSSKTIRVGLGKFGRVPLTIREAANEQRQLRQKHTIPGIEGDYNNTIKKFAEGEDLRKKTRRQTHGHSFRGGDPIPTLKKAYDDYIEDGGLALNTEKSY